MAYFSNNFPKVRMSDIDELLRETELDSADGKKLVEYINRKRGGARARLHNLFDSSDNEININLDHIQPVTGATETSPNNEGVTTRSREATRSPAASPGRTQPQPSNKAEDRNASFIGSYQVPGPSVQTALLPTSELVTKSPRTSQANDPSRAALIQQYRRSNQMKCEKLRLVNQIASSTPIVRNSNDKRCPSYIAIPDSISPILDQQPIPGTPPRPTGSVHERPVIQITVPATQTDVPDAVEQSSARPREHAVTIIPETPSPVRESPPPLSPRRALSVRRMLLANEREGQDVSSPRKSILKKTPKQPASSKLRVSFSEQLNVREMSPNSSERDDAEVTSDESEPDVPVRRSPRKANHPCPSGATRMYATDGRKSVLMVPSTVTKRTDIKDVLREQSNGNITNMILEDWDDGVSDTDSPRRNHQTNSSPVPINNVETMRSVLAEIYEPPSAFGDDDVDHCQPEAPSPARGSSLPPVGEGEQANPEPNSGHEPGRHEPGGLALEINASQSAAESQWRIRSISTPTDVVPSSMINAVDMIHCGAGKDPPIPIGADTLAERRTTVMPPSRRPSRPKINDETVQYFDVIEKTCAKAAAEKPRPKERRKLFVREIAQAEQPGRITSPEPLPPTPEEDDIVLRPCSVMLERIAPDVISALTTAPTRGNSPDTNESPEGEADLPIVEAPPVELPAGEPPAAEPPAAEPPAAEQPAVEPPVGEPLAVSRGRVRGRTKNSTKRKNSPKKTTGKKKRDTSDDWAKSRHGLKDVSNEVRETMEENGPRRSKRSRRLAQEVIRNNPGIRANDPPQYRTTTMEDLLRLYYLTGSIQTPEYKRRHKKSSKKRKDEKNAESGDRDRSKKNNRPAANEGVADEHFDAEGFRIPKPVEKESKSASSQHKNPPSHQGKDSTSRQKKDSSSQRKKDDGSSRDEGVTSLQNHREPSPSRDEPPETRAKGKKRPGELSSTSSEEQPGPSRRPLQKESAVAKKRQPRELNFSKTNIFNLNGTATDSGLSSAVDEGTSSVRPEKVADAYSAPLNILEEKRKTFDWMVHLMDNIENRPESLPTIGPSGMVHMTVDHLNFTRRGQIEYAFYIYANGNNFGFIRFLPNATKKTTRTKNCVLKILMLGGGIKVHVDHNEVTAAPGDFMILPVNTSYRMTNGPAATLMFIVKTIVEE